MSIFMKGISPSNIVGLAMMIAECLLRRYIYSNVIKRTYAMVQACHERIHADVLHTHTPVRQTQRGTQNSK